MIKGTQGWGLCAFVVFSGLAGCDGESQGGPVTLADAPQRFSDAICARDYRCGGPLSLGFAFASAADCQTAYGAFYGDFFATIQEQVDEGAVEYVPEAV